MSSLTTFHSELDELKTKNLYRTLRRVDGAQGVKIQVGGRELLNFSSNDYLGLANHPLLIEAAVKAVEKWGVGTGASRLISGNLGILEELEERIAKFKNMEDAVVFSSGYAANCGIISALVRQGDVVVSDRLNHASIIDGCRLSKAKLRVYKHSNIEDLRKVLSGNKGSRQLVITESIFSMDGDIAPLPEIVDAVKQSDALLMVDDAHATGLLGRDGRGSAEHFGLEGRILIQMGTLSKALGCQGGFVAGTKELCNYIRNKARSFIYSTGLSPVSAAAAIAALDIIESEEGRILRERLWKNINLMNGWFLIEDSARRERKLPPLKKGDRGGFKEQRATPIIPIIIGDNQKTLAIAKHLFDNGIFVPAIRPPTVPEGTARLRLSISAAHREEDLEKLKNALDSGNMME